MSDISELEDKKTQYSNMRRSIDSIVEDLKRAKSYMEQSDEKLREAYSGNLLEEKSKIVTDNLELIKNIKNELDKDIQIAIGAKTREIQAQIDQIEAEMSETTDT